VCVVRYGMQGVAGSWRGTPRRWRGSPVIAMRRARHGGRRRGGVAPLWPCPARLVRAAAASSPAVAESRAAGPRGGDGRHRAEQSRREEAETSARAPARRTGGGGRWGHRACRVEGGGRVAPRRCRASRRWTSRLGGPSARGGAVPRCGDEVGPPLGEEIEATLAGLPPRRLRRQGT
jgi:hypothetical protein